MLSHFVGNCLIGGSKVVSLVSWPHFTPTKIPGRISSTEKSSVLIENQKMRPSSMQHSVSVNCATPCPLAVMDIAIIANPKV
jgi:hypothetical protein